MKASLFTPLLFALVLLFSAGCERMDKHQYIKGDRNIVTTKRSVEPFNGLSSTGDFVVVFRRSDACGVTVTVDQNLQDYIYTEVIDGVLTIGTPDNCLLKASKTLLIEIDYTELTMLDLAGAVKLRNEDTLTFDSLKVTCAGASNFDWVMEGHYFEVHIPGASSMNLSGNVGQVRMQLDGASSVDATNLTARIFSLNMAGASKVSLLATEQLDVDLAGAGIVNYKGNPSVKNFSINGFGRVVPDDAN